MGKKVLSLCMALVLCLTLLPATALAAGEDAPNTLYVGQTQITEGGYWTTAANGTLTSGNADNYNVHYDGNGTLTLKNATIQGRGDISQGDPIDYGIYAAPTDGQSVSLTIKLIGSNTVSGYSGIYVGASDGDSTLVIQSDTNGSLEANGSGWNGITMSSNSGNVSLTINNASVEASTKRTGYYGVSVTSNAGSPTISLTVNGGSLTAQGDSGLSGIRYFFQTNASNPSISLTVQNNAWVKAMPGIATAASMASKPTMQGNGIVFDGNSGTVYGNVTLQEDLEIGTDETLTIPEGSSLTSNDKLTNNGTVTIENGGTLTDADKVTNNGTINVEDGGTLGGTPTGTVVYAPTITTQPAGQEVTVGQTATFIIEATGENLSYQWQQKTTDSGSEWEDISNATTASYTTAATTTDMSGYQYRCVVSNSAGSVTSNAATLTVNAATVSVTGVTLNKTSTELTVGQSETLTATVQPDDATNKAMNWSSSNEAVATVDTNGKVTAVGEGNATITATAADGSNISATCTVTVEKPYTPPPYIPPTKTPSQQAIDKIEDAKEGSTVKITLRTGQTKLDKEVFEELAGRDVTLEISLPGGVTWTVNGEDIPQTADLTDLDMGVSLNTSTIPVDLINAITGEIGTVQLTLKHDGPFGFTMTLTAPLGKENAGYWANLYHYDEDAGEMVYQTAALVDEDGNAALPFDHASQYALVLDSKSHDLPFTDLAANAWYTDAVAYVYRHDIMEGMSATTFQPNGTLSRAMAVQIFYNLEGQPDISSENLGYPYEDVNAEEWYGNAVYWARITGVATGYGDGTFQPGDSITRQEFAQMLYNYAKYKGYDLTAEGDLAQFPDSGSVADWAETAMSWANGNELINGHDDGTIDAGGAGTRTQAASILMRFDQNLIEK